MSLLIEIDRFCRARNMPVTKFGRLAAHDPRLVHDLRWLILVAPAVFTAALGRAAALHLKSQL